MELYTRRWLGGVETRAGGTRKGIKLSRPWQQEISFTGSSCPFETKPQEVLWQFNCGVGGKWLVLGNKFTPFDSHELIIPDKCWPISELRTLGGQGKIEAAFSIADGAIRIAKGKEVWMGIHIGPTAGQNLLHLHWHVLQPMLSETSLAGMANVLTFADLQNQISVSAGDSGLFVFEESGIRVSVGGVRVGQCFITPGTKNGLHPPISLGQDFSARVSLALTRLITLCNEKFRSESGLSPEYMIWLVFNEGKFYFGFYLPILNHPGFTEWMAAMAPQRYPMILPWSQVETAAHLRGEGI